MGYFNIIDSLNDAKVNEGMTESIPKNKNNDIDKLVKALQSCDIDFIPDKYIKCYKSFYNRSSFSKNFVDNVIKWTGMLKNKSNNGAKLYMLCLGDGGRFFMVFEAPRFSRLSRCFVFKVPDEATMESIFELANDGKMTFDIDNPKLDGCKLIADTYCIHDIFTEFDRGKIVGVDTRLMADTVVVMETLFEDFAKVFKFNYKNDNYDFVVGEIAKACVNYEISFTEVGFVVTLDFGVAKERNRIEMILNNRKGGHSLRFLKDGKSKIKLSGGFI